MNLTGKTYFVIAGAQRSGTTWLAQQLDAHPEIYLAKPTVPEPKFYSSDSEYAKGCEYYRQRYFSETGAAKAIGEKSTSYLESAVTPERIKACFPEAKVIVMLRNPVQRAVSNYYFSRKHGLETRMLEEVFLEQKPAPALAQSVSVSPFEYLERGIYLPYLQRFAEVLGKEQLRVLLFEETVGNLKQVQSLYQWLGVAPDFVPADIREKQNAAEEAYSIPDSVSDVLTAYYKSHNQALADFLETDLSCWEQRG